MTKPVPRPPGAPLNFVQIERLRRHMLLSARDMAQLFGVSRMTYYGWVRGKNTARAKNEAQIRAVLRQLLALMADERWPTPETIAEGGKTRLARLREVLDSN